MTLNTLSITHSPFSKRETALLCVTSIVLGGLRLPPHKIFKHLPNFKHLNSRRAQSSYTKKKRVLSEI